MPIRRLPRQVALAAASASLAVSLLPAAAGAQAVTPRACPSGSDGPPSGSRCGRLAVPLDRTGATPGSVSLNLAVVPATGQRKGTLAIVTGGPGEPAVPAARLFSAGLSDVREDYDLVFVDQRGSGGSDAVRCRSIETAAAVRRCAAALGPRRPFLTTKETALDLEDVRTALGAEKLSLLGISYGGKVAGEYARRFPARTERVVLDSTAPVDGLDTSLQLRQLGLPRVLDEICEPGCDGFLPNPNVALRALVRRLDRAALRGRIVLPSGRTTAARVTVEDVYGLVVASDLDPRLRLELPAAIAAGTLGDAQPLLRLLAAPVPEEDEETGVNQARLLATSCVEGRLPWAPDSPVEGREKALVDAFNAAPAATFAPFDRETVAGASLAALCSVWPSTPKPETVPARGPDVPVLVLAGRDDLRTPLEDARRTASQYPNATVLAVPSVGHSVLVSDTTPCSASGVTAFLAGAPVAKCSRTVDLVVAPFVPASVSALPPLRGTTGPAGRVGTAVAATLLDASRAIVRQAGTGLATVPGLRGGSLVLSRDGASVRLRAYEVVRGVRVSGTLRERGGTVTVTGPGGVTGVLSAGRGDRFRGTIGGQRVSFVLR